jgi:histidine ammonia-lyase
MGWGAGRKLWQVLDNASRAVAVEMLCAVQGIEYRAPLVPGTGSAAAVAALRRAVPPLDDDRPIGAEIEAVAAMIENGTIVDAVTAATAGAT